MKRIIKHLRQTPPHLKIHNLAREESPVQIIAMQCESCIHVLGAMLQGEQESSHIEGDR